MEEIILEVDPRQERGRSKVANLREQGFIPGVVYSGGKEAVSMKLARRQFLQMLHEHRLENMIITVKVKGDNTGKGRPCMIKEMQHDPVHDHIIHIDFVEISLTKVIKVNVPVSVRGESVGVKQEGGSLEHILWEIEVECLPANIPQNVEIDISKLKIGDSVHIKDIVFSSEVKVMNDPDAVVVTVSAPMKVEEPADGAEGDEKKEPEVIKEKKVAAEEGETKK